MYAIRSYYDNLIASSALAAGIAIKNLMAEFNLPGTLHIIGTPGEESKGGKIDMINCGAFDGIDCALICHPYSATLPDQGMLAVSRFDVDFYGEPAHAATAPHDGKKCPRRNDAVVITSYSIHYTKLYEENR